jgi:hypothetical protein
MAKQYVVAAGNFHNTVDESKVSVITPYRQTWFTYHFENAFHPYVGELAERVNKQSLTGLYDPLFLGTLRSTRNGNTVDSFFDYFGSDTTYINPNVADAEVDGEARTIDLEGGPYSNYNWELLFHVPLTIAVHLSKNQRFAEAQRWFHYIFDPTASERFGAVPERYWKFPAFRGAQPPLQIDRLLTLLSKEVSSLSHAERRERERLLQGYAAILRNPFQPHRVARTRPLAYQFNVVMKYLDNLIAWGDSLFRQDTIESINEATQRYILAANVLGQRPERIPERGAVRPKSFADLLASGLDQTGNALVDLESKFPFNLGLPSLSGSGAANSGPLFGIGRTLYFCVPRNEKLLGYWDVVADRLYKIRHCLNIEGVFRQLALFDPPIDPGMLVKAAAAGIDVGSMVRGLYQPLGPVRATTLIQKALEICAEVRSLGGALLSAAEKRDTEQLTLIRQRHERRIQELSRETRYLQLQQAKEGTQSLLSSRAASFERYKFYARLLNLPLDPALPANFSLDRRELTEENFDEAFRSLVEQYDRQPALQELPALRMANGGDPGVTAGALGAGKLYLNSNEDLELNKLLPAAALARTAASVAELLAPVLVFIPNIYVDLHYWGLGAHTEVFSGPKASEAARTTAEILKVGAALASEAAGMAARTAGHERRADEWLNQYNLAALELKQNGRQILTSLIAEKIAQREFDTIVRQIEHTQEVDEFMQQKFTSEELHAWMQGEIARLYYDYYRFAFDTARRAELGMKRELMRPEVDGTDFVKFNYWDGGRKGLLAGEALHLDVKRLEMAYLDNNRRELEITRHVSLRQLDPMALILLRATGSCDVNLPEWLFDLDCPGHYLRRIRSVALSLPAVTGPYVGMHCTLSLLRSSVRVSPAPKDNAYARQGLDDDRFVNYFGAIQSVVTSSGTNDTGLFEANLRDERLLPFENCGVESSWRLELPGDFRGFDYSSISDAILHIRYTARAGVPRALVTQYLNDSVFALNAPTGLALLIDVRSEFPAEWARFMAGGTLDLRVGRERFPYLVQNVPGKTLRITGIDAISANAAARHAVGDPAAATTAFSAAGSFTLSLPADAAGADAVLLRQASVRPQLLVRYGLA